CSRSARDYGLDYW
nr:immunoglobulin heavy chain junction region [Mus musculus]MBK4189410.1 immunoglobulin heavy chain junction region [Mus musculus]